MTSYYRHVLTDKYKHMNGSEPNKITYTVHTKNNYLSTSHKQQKSKYHFSALQVKPSFFPIESFSQSDAFVVFLKNRNWVLLKTRVQGFHPWDRSSAHWQEQAEGAV